MKPSDFEDFQLVDPAEGFSAVLAWASVIEPKGGYRVILHLVRDSGTDGPKVVVPYQDLMRKGLQRLDLVSIESAMITMFEDEIANLDDVQRTTYAEKAGTLWTCADCGKMMTGLRHQGECMKRISAEMLAEAARDEMDSHFLPRREKAVGMVDALNASRGTPRRYRLVNWVGSDLYAIIKNVGKQEQNETGYRKIEDIEAWMEGAMNGYEKGRKDAAK